MKLLGISFVYILVFTLSMGFCEDVNAARILFIGNSFTGYSIQTLRRFSEMSPYGADELEFQLLSGTTLEAHTTRVKTLQAIQCKRFDYVVLQDHSQQTLNDPQSFAFGVSTFVSMARDNGAQPLLYET